MDSYITRAELLTAMGATPGGASTQDVVAQALAHLGWTDKERFAQQDVIRLLEAITAAGRAQVVASEDPAIVASRDHLVPLLDALQAHAFPVLTAQA